MKKFFKLIWSYIGDIHFVGRSPFDHHTVPPPPAEHSLENELNALIVVWKDAEKATIHRKVQETLRFCSESLQTVLKNHYRE